MSKVLNRDSNLLEEAKKQQCHQCKGFGGIISERGNPCSVCKGRGQIWKSASGWWRPIGSSVNNTKLF